MFKGYMTVYKNCVISHVKKDYNRLYLSENSIKFILQYTTHGKCKNIFIGKYKNISLTTVPQYNNHMACREGTQTW
jgi:hypothetical protein